MVELARREDLALRLKASKDDPDLVLSLTRASARFEGEIGYPVMQVRDEVVYLHGRGTRVLHLPAVPIAGDLVVKVDGTVIPATGYAVGRSDGILERRDRPWPRGLDNVEVTYTHGYESVPGDIADAVLEQAEAIHRVLPAVASAAAGRENISFFATASSGVTQRWSDAVKRYSLSGGDDA